MAVPLLDVNAQNLPLEDELTTAFKRVLRSGHFIMGPDVPALESEIASMVGAKDAIGVSSGTDAILLALMALGIGPGDEVLCPSFTFFATAGCVARVGAKPVFVDADPVTFNLDVDDAAKKVTQQTRAIIPVHLFGQCADMDKVMQLAKAHNIFVIEDAAQSLGSKYKERSAGSIGTFGTYSFFPSKNLGALGDAGMIACSDATLAERTRLLRTHGAQPKYYHKYIGGNFRLDSLQAAFLRVKLAHYNEYTSKRKANAAYYTAQLGSLSGVSFKKPSELSLGIILPQALPNYDHIWNQYTIRVTGAGRRDQMRKYLSDRGIATEVYYPVPMHQQECFAHLSMADSCPMAALLGNEVLSLPVYPELLPSARDEVIEAISTFLKAEK